MFTGTFIRNCCIFLVATTIVACSNPQKDTVNNNGWISLFNGKDLNDWVVKIYHHEVGDNFGNTFRVEDSMIKVRYDQYDAFNDQFGHLYYKKPFSHYHLVVEYKFADEWKKDAPGYTELNSGIMFHTQDPHTILKEQNWPISVEFQLLAGLADGKPRSTGNMCSPGTNIVYNGVLDSTHCINSTSKTYGKDEWIRAELIVLGDSSITHIVNGDTVMRYSKPQIGGSVISGYDPKMKPDGKILSSGFIALQSEGQPIDFRKVEIKELK